MTREEAREIIRTMYAAYPTAVRGMTADELTETVNMWAALFAEEPVQLVAAALKGCILADTKGFPPSPGQVMNKIKQITEPDTMTEVEAWALVSKAIKHSGYIERANEEWEKLPESIQSIVRPTQLREWALQDSRDLQTVVASNFMRSFRAKQIQQAEYDLLPADVKAAIERYKAAQLPKGGENVNFKSL